MTVSEDARIMDSGTRDRETDEFESPEPRGSSSPLLTDGGGGSRSSAESSTESAHELGKSS